LSDFRPCTRLTFTVGRDVGSATPWPWSWSSSFRPRTCARSRLQY